MNETSALAKDSAQLRLRMLSLRGAAPALTVEAFLWLHEALFVGIEASAGQARAFALDSDGFGFARPRDIRASLEERFAHVEAADGFRAASREQFYHLLAHHIAELYAIQPFATGNRRTIALHVEQLANAAGYPLHICEIEKSTWDDALDLGFADRDSAAIAHLLSGAPRRDDSVKQGGWVGVGGIALLPDRYPPRGRRRLTPLARARQQVNESLHAAIDEAERSLAKGGRGPAALQELEWLRHAKGPLFQIALLSDIGFGKIDILVDSSHSALERVREIGYGLLVGIVQQPIVVIESALRRLKRGRYARGGSPHLDRMADQFLRNSPSANREDSRFSALQREADEIARNTSLLEGRDPVPLNMVVEQLRQQIAAQIRTGARLDDDVPNILKKVTPETRRVGE